MKLTSDEYIWIKEQVRRLVKLKELVLKDAYYGTNEENLDILATKFKPVMRSTIGLSRNDLRLLMKATDLMRKGLQLKTIPGYEKKVRDNAAKYKKYLTKARNTLTMLEELYDKLESQL